ncbi:MAG: ribbon-helix-helix protein, CopG family [Nitrososphaerota archaeon]|nr:ribbon-helix-helix protein, CopG family [Nitrososphaerota archaeon]
MTREKYVTVKIPSELAAILDDLAGEMGYRSRAEIVNDSIRRFIDAHRTHAELEEIGRRKQQERLSYSRA